MRHFLLLATAFTLFTTAGCEAQAGKRGTPTEEPAPSDDAEAAPVQPADDDAAKIEDGPTGDTVCCTCTCASGNSVSNPKYTLNGIVDTDDARRDHCNTYCTGLSSTAQVCSLLNYISGECSKSE